MREEASEISAALTSPITQARKKSGAKSRQVQVGIAVCTLWVFGGNDKSGCRLGLVEICLIDE